MKPTPDDLRTLIREALVLHGTGAYVLTYWQREARDGGLSPLDAAALVTEVSRQVNDNRVLLDNIAGRARRLARNQFNGQLTPDDLRLLSTAAQPLGLSAEFVRDRWMPALFAVPATPAEPVVPAPTPAPQLVPPVSMPIVIDWLVPADAPDHDQPVLAVHAPAPPEPPKAPTVLPTPPEPAPSPTLPAQPTVPAAAPVQPVAPTPVAPADPYSALVNREPMRPVAPSQPVKPFWETTGGIVGLAVLVTVLLIGGILFIGRSDKGTDSVDSSTTGRILSRQMGYRWTVGMSRMLLLGVNATVRPMVALRGPVSRKDQWAEHVTENLADKSYEWRASFANLPVGLYRVTATLPETKSGRAITVIGYVKLDKTPPTQEAAVSKTRPATDPEPQPIATTKPVQDVPAEPEPAPAKPAKNPYRVQPEPDLPTQDDMSKPDKILSERGQYGEQAAQRNGKWGLWRNKTWMIQPIYDDISLFRDRRAVVTLAGQTFDIDYFGSRIRDSQ